MNIAQLMAKAASEGLNQEEKDKLQSMMSDTITLSKPEYLEAEQIVLLGLLKGKMINHELTVDDFNNEQHKKVFMTLSLSKCGESLFLLSLFVKNGKLDTDNIDDDYFDAIGNILQAPHVPNLGVYVDIVRERSILRKLIALSKKAMEIT